MNSQEIIEIIGAVVEGITMIGLAFGFKIHKAQKKKTYLLHQETLKLIDNKIAQFEKEAK